MGCCSDSSDPLQMPSSDWSRHCIRSVSPPTVWTPKLSIFSCQRLLMYQAILIDLTCATFKPNPWAAVHGLRRHTRSANLQKSLVSRIVSLEGDNRIAACVRKCLSAWVTPLSFGFYAEQQISALSYVNTTVSSSDSININDLIRFVLLQ